MTRDLSYPLAVIVGMLSMVITRWAVYRWPDGRNRAQDKHQERMDALKCRRDEEELEQHDEHE